MINSQKILLDHGSGGRASQTLISEIILKNFANPILADLDDSAALKLQSSEIAFSTDSYTVDPIFFPGGDIGELAINGTVNDLAMKGAIPLYLSVGFIIEEGFSLESFKKIIMSMRAAAQIAGVQIVTGDTKVVGKGSADKIFINTSGIGIIPENVFISGKNAKPGDKIILSGTIGDHGITIMTQREGLRLDSPLRSDSAPLNKMVAELLENNIEIHVLRDPTRGGLATTLNEIALQSKIGIQIFEDTIPVSGPVASACELLGLDPLMLANEGKLIAFVPSDVARLALGIIKKNKYGKMASIIGEVTSEHQGKVIMKTTIGGSRIVDMLTGSPLPRIC